MRIRVNDLSDFDGAPTSESALSTQRVTDELRALILSGELAPGSRIGQEELATRFAVSRIPVRGALARLESDGLVVLKPSSGAWVARLDLKECLEVYRIRERIEPLALEESVPRLSDAEIVALAALAEDMVDSPDTETFLRLDRQFHLASYRHADMHQLLQMIERFWNTTQHYRRAFTKLLGRERNWIIHAEHRLIVDAIRRRDARGAGNLLMEHIRRTRLELAQHEDLFPTTETPRRRRARK